MFRLVQSPKCFVDVDLSACDLLHELYARRRWRRGRALDTHLCKQRVEPRSGGRIADSKMSLEVLHVSARGKKDPQHLAIFVR